MNTRDFTLNGEPVTVVQDYAYCTKVTCTDKGKYVWVQEKPNTTPYMALVDKLVPA